jgi:hypothetical protein
MLLLRRQPSYRSTDNRPNKDQDDYRDDGDAFPTLPKGRMRRG